MRASMTSASSSLAARSVGINVPSSSSVIRGPSFRVHQFDQGGPYPRGDSHCGLDVPVPARVDQLVMPADGAAPQKRTEAQPLQPSDQRELALNGAGQSLV